MVSIEKLVALNYETDGTGFISSSISLGNLMALDLQKWWHLFLYDSRCVGSSADFCVSAHIVWRCEYMILVSS
jgi:hypothetical protein